MLGLHSFFCEMALHNASRRHVVLLFNWRCQLRSGVQLAHRLPSFTLNVAQFYCDGISSCVLARHWVLISFSQHVICLSVALQVTRTWFASTCCSLEVTELITCKCSCYQCYTISMDLRMGSSEVTAYFFISLFSNHLQIQCVTNSAITRADDSNLY